MITPATLRLIDLALDEDLGRGDVTSEAIFAPGTPARGTIVAKQEIVLAGIEVAAAVFHRVDPRIDVRLRHQDGDVLAKGEVAAEIAGAARSVLGAERTALNFLQRLSGIATHTRTFVRATAGTRARVVDTRKTMPGWRVLDKAAVRAGGGRNHRADLASGILIKDNHIAAAGSVEQAVARARAAASHLSRVEVEVSTEAALDEALRAGADVVLLDNVDPAMARRLVERTAGRALVEVSGGVTLETVRSYAESGVDLISIGALTHSPRAADLSLELEAGP
ncbi:MAG TPA: carboxylating nicotinate-nucleotide diphosphorylase [Polyangia bacterium]|nr:carboxylating nicotinate-nucleotide diphosphorylase [Polyangia bacterium]